MSTAAPAPPVPEVPAIEDTLVTPSAVHLVVRIDRDWEADREAAVADLEDKIAAADRYADSPAFRALHGDRLGIARVRVKVEPPSVVRAVMEERGIELEVIGAPARGICECELCHRGGFADEQRRLTDGGWACPTCASAWARGKEGKRGFKPALGIRDAEAHAGQLRTLQSRLVFPLLAAIVVLFAIGAAIELKLLTRINNNFKMHLPKE